MKSIKFFLEERMSGFLLLFFAMAIITLASANV